MLTAYSFTYDSLVSMPQSLHTGAEKRSHIRKKLMSGSPT